MDVEPQLSGCLDQDGASLVAERLVHLDVAHSDVGVAWGAVVKRGLSLEGAVDELVEDDNVSRVDILSEGATGRGSKDVRAAFLFQGVDIGTVVDVGRR